MSYTLNYINHFFFVQILFIFIVIRPAQSFLCDKILDNNAFFSLDSLKSSSDFTYEYYENSIHYRLYYSFCGLTSKTCKGFSAYALLFKIDSSNIEENSTCIHLSSTSTLSNFAYSLNNPDDASDGIQLSLMNGDSYTSSSSSQSSYYQAIFMIYCTKNQLPVPFLISEITNDQNQYLIIGESLAGCPIIENNPVYQFIIDNRIVIGIIMIIIGFIECFLGLAIIKETIFFVGFLSAFGFLMMIFGEFFLTIETGVFTTWIMILIAVLIGGLIGYIATSLPKIGFLFMGFWIGFIMAFMVNNLFLYKVQIDPPGLLLYVIMCIFGCIFGLLSACIWRHICIVGTSFLGSYLVVRCFSLYIGSYPNELSVPFMLKFKEIEYVEWPFYVYFIFIMLFTSLGMMLQFRNKRKIGGRFAGKYYEDLLEDEDNKNLNAKKTKDFKGKEEKKTESDKELKYTERNENQVDIEMAEHQEYEENGENGENREIENNGDMEENYEVKKKKKKKKKKHHHKKENLDGEIRRDYDDDE